MRCPTKLRAAKRLSAYGAERKTPAGVIMWRIEAMKANLFPFPPINTSSVRRYSTIAENRWATCEIVMPMLIPILEQESSPTMPTVAAPRELSVTRLLISSSYSSITFGQQCYQPRKPPPKRPLLLKQISAFCDFRKINGIPPHQFVYPTKCAT
jgi:hypothetical protein